MGWAGIALGADFLGALNPETVSLMMVGGALYTIGVLFFLSERLQFHNTIWHGFVLVATVIFYLAILTELVPPQHLA